MSDFPESRTSPFPNTSLLRLSQGTRHRIYRYLGLASWDGHPYRFCLQGGRIWRSNRDSFSYAPNPTFFHGLLLCCRDIYVEAAALLYSTNLFILHYSDLNPPRRAGAQPPLQALYDLTPSALLSLSHLKIVINESACHQPVINDYQTCCLQGHKDYALLDISCRSCRKSNRWHDAHNHQLPLLSLPSTDDHHDELAIAHSVLTNWCSAAIHLFAHVTPGRLAFSLVCDIDPRHPRALDIAKAVVAPLHRLPQSYLRECNIRLAKSADHRFQRLAQETVFHAVGAATPISNPPSNATTTLTTLPRELRLRILEYTDLITPRKDVIWTRQRRAYTVMYLGWDSNPRLPTSDVHHGSQFFSCWDKTNINNGKGTTSGCFCRRHAAFSFICQCWVPPGPALFLISRTLCEDARFVFFSGNRFTIHDYKLSPPWELPMLGQKEHNWPVPTYPYPYERFVASDFLCNVVPACALTHLRFLDLVFPPYRVRSWPEKEHPVMQDWWATVDWLRGKINPPALTLRLVVSDLGDAPSTYYRTITNQEGDALFEAHLNLLQPLASLGKDGLARFYARFPYPWECTEENDARRNRDPKFWKWLRGQEEALKERAERYVMGERYESLYANGREEPELPHSSGERWIWPCAHVWLGEKGVADGAPRKHACATPEKAAPASNTSGYEPAITLVIMAPDEPPMTYTLAASPLYLSSVYLTMLMIPAASPPPLCVKLAGFWTSQHCQRG
ncbi:hypothetical protein B0I37DRAFT_437911 [Chaetomium sp. MPI-CAGE-AT-0009]|nr:hypothetical protein B0I37DRAFT_437911 [Chaetomium sp. MPI-CAGE-AT-0009]